MGGEKMKADISPGSAKDGSGKDEKRIIKIWQRVHKSTYLFSKKKKKKKKSI
jgi:hypothetical protein